MWQNLVTFVITTKQITRFKNPIPMNKGTSFISEIDKYFKNNDATSAMNKIMEITRTLSFSEKRLFGEQSRCYCKYSQIACIAITAIQYNILATARRFSSYETI